MTGKTHQIIGITASLSWFLMSNKPEYQPATFAFVAAASCFGALLPDIDQPAAKIWHVLPFGDTVSEVFEGVLDHRNITHSIFGLLLFGFGFFELVVHFPSYWGINSSIVLIAFMISYFSHILADMFTVEGLPLLFPIKIMFGIPPKPFDGLRILTGKWFENLVIFPFFNLIFIILVIAKWSVIKLIIFK
ncbi:MAG: metal-dependent hydrolase [Patescibacteria group bacterium]|jgi:inner membrane protein